MTRRLRLLFLCQTLPYPPDGGVWIRTYHVLRLLAREFDVTMLCFERMGSASGRDLASIDRSLAHLRTLAEVELFEIPQAHSRLRYLWDHVRSVLWRRPYTAFVYDSAEFTARLRARVREGFDVVHADSLVDLARFLPLVGRPPNGVRAS